VPDQTTDPRVSRAKFEREVAQFQAVATDYRRRGWFLASAEFPVALLLATAPQLQPAAVVTGVRFDYTDYDRRPPSVRLVNPFTEEPYKAKELPTLMNRAVEVQSGFPPGFIVPGGGEMPKMIQHQPLMQQYGPDDIPFLCIAGVREYHEHPGHTGDPWELHRAAGAGRLITLIEVIDTYGVRPLSGYNVNLLPQITGFAETEVPT
jgi:Predicted metal binding domain